MIHVDVMEKQVEHKGLSETFVSFVKSPLKSEGRYFDSYLTVLYSNGPIQISFR